MKFLKIYLSCLLTACGRLSEVLPKNQICVSIIEDQVKYQNEKLTAAAYARKYEWMQTWQFNLVFAV